MSKIEDRLLEEKVRLIELSAPEELEARLSKALNTAVPRRNVIWNVKNGWRIAVVVLVVILFAGNHYHALAYYGKMLLGFDGFLYGTLSELNRQGKGQALNKGFQLADGTMFTINGIISDENQFILYYTLSNPNGLRSYDGFDPIGIKGFRTDSHIQGGATSGPTGGVTETKGFLAFEPVSPLANKLTLSYWWKELPESNQRHEGQITFPHAPDEAMSTKIKQAVNVTLDGKTITIGTITATPTMTLIEGTLQAENKQLNQAVLNGIDLIANGDSVPIFSSEVQHRTTDRKAISFSLQYDALPENLYSVQLILKQTGDMVEIPVK